jgi:hypothetical protein
MIVVVTFVHVKITLRVQITLCVLKSHYVCENQTISVKHHAVRELITLEHVF